jgi:hypothetical protein
MVKFPNASAGLHDRNDVTHSLEVSAGTLYEAVVRALTAMRGNDWVGEIGKGLTEVTVRVRELEIAHTVRMNDFKKWLNRHGKTPAEIVLKSHLREILGMPQ